MRLHRLLCECRDKGATAHMRRPALGDSLHFPPCLRQGLLLAARGNMLAGLQASGDSPVSASYVTSGALGHRHTCYYCAYLLMYPRDPNSGPHVCMASTLPTEVYSGLAAMVSVCG